MRVECIDVETFKFTEGRAAPPLVCMSWTDGVSENLLVPWEHDPWEFVANLLLRGDTILVNHHIFFDLAVLCAERPRLLSIVMDALERGLIRCTKVREKLIRIALGEAKFIEEDEDDDDEDEEVGGGRQMAKTLFDLAACAWRWLRRRVAKVDTWRTSYALLYGVGLERWPESAKRYVCTDARTALDVWRAQDAFVQVNFVNGILPGETDACCASFILALMRVWGVRTNPEAVAALKRELQIKVLWTAIGLSMSSADGRWAPLLRHGGTRNKPKFVETKSAVQERVVAAFVAQGHEVPFTKPSPTFPQGQVKTAKKVLDDSGDPELGVLAEYKGYVKILSTYIPRYVEKGIKVPICADWNALVESFRISCAKPNLTNPPRAGNVRDCIEARVIHTFEEIVRLVFVSADFDQAELRSWAEVCLKMFGYSTMADAFRQGIDPHVKLGAELLGLTLEDGQRRYADGDKVMEDSRQFSKEPNFGLIGGMGWKKFQERAALKKIMLTAERTKQIRFAWMRTWPEAKQYLDYFEQHYDEPGTIVHPITGMVRGGCGYTDGANHMFQHLTAIGTKQALWDLGKECFAIPSSVLYGTRPIIDMHDEIFGETPEVRGHVVAPRWGAVMKAGMEKWIKHVPVKCTPVLARRLYKGTKPVHKCGGCGGESGSGGPCLACGRETRLVPSKPVREGGKTKWVADL